MNIELTDLEKVFLKEFAEKQHIGAKDNCLTDRPIHVVEREIDIYYRDIGSEKWCYDEEDTALLFDNFAEMLKYIREEKDETLPTYNEVEFETRNGIEIYVEEDYCKAFDIDAYPANCFTTYEPVAYFFIRDEAERYMTEYQAHNCKNCRIYSHWFGYQNKGDYPIFYDLLMKMGLNLLNEDKER